MKGLLFPSGPLFLLCMANPSARPFPVSWLPFLLPCRGLGSWVAYPQQMSWFLKLSEIFDNCEERHICETLFHGYHFGYATLSGERKHPKVSLSTFKKRKANQTVTCISLSTNWSWDQVEMAAGSNQTITLPCCTADPWRTRRSGVPTSRSAENPHIAV